MNFQDSTRTFTGNWITNEEFAHREPVYMFHRQLEKVELPEEPLKNQHILFRKKVTLAQCEKATLYITADDYYKLYINGQYVAMGPAAGYPWHYYYNKIDVTQFLQPGENVIAVHTYYQGLINRVWVSGDGRHGLLFDLECDGQIVAQSDTSVLCHKHTAYTEMGLSGYSTQFLECYDSRSAQIGFEKPEFDDTAWSPALIRKDMGIEMYEQKSKQVVLDEIVPVLVSEDGPGKYFVDMGAAYVGYLNVEAVGKTGDRVTLRYGQELTEDGEVRFELRANCRYEEAWILSGGEDKLNNYDYKSFRYVEITCPEGTQLNAITMLVRHYPFTLKAKCQVEDPRLQAIWNLCVHSLHYGAQECLMDCMEREKGFYLGDGCFTTTSFAVLTGDTSIMEKLIDDIMYSSCITPGLMTCASCSTMQEIGDYCLMLPRLVRVHQHLTGDVEYTRARYDVLKNMMLYFKEHYSEESGMIGGLDKWVVVDWPHECRDGYDHDLTEGKVIPGIHNVINAYYVMAARDMEIMAKELGVEAPFDSAPLAEKYVEIFWDAEQKLFRDRPGSDHCSLPSNVMALLGGFAPDNSEILKMIRQKTLKKVAFFMGMACLSGLWRIGEKQLAHDLIADDATWSRMLREGATSTWEAWGADGKWNTSLFHLAFVYPVLFMTEWGMEEVL